MNHMKNNYPKEIKFLNKICYSEKVFIKFVFIKIFCFVNNF